MFKLFNDKLANKLLWLLQLFIGVGAIFGGIGLIIHPDGSFLQIPIELLANSPFTSYLIPVINDN